MNYNIIKLNETEKLEEYNPSIILQEDKFLDNKKYILQIKNFNIGFSYYDLGINYNVLILNKVIYLGFGMSILICNIDRREKIYSKTDILQVVYEILHFQDISTVVYICEAKIVCFNEEGKFIREYGFFESIYDYNVGSDRIEILFEESKKQTIILNDNI